MKILEKLKNKECDMFGGEPVTIAFLGDSVTHGCFELYRDRNNALETVFERRNGYSMRLARMLEMLYPRVQINVVNAGISGDNVQNGALRLERDVLRFHPDLTVVCFGLNDCMAGTEPEKIGAYAAALRTVLEKLKESGEVIFMTPNMMCTYVSNRITDEGYREVAKSVCEAMKKGNLEKYLEAAKETARSCNVKVCDCYARWKKLEAAGVDTTELLSNLINHPTREMHDLFAISLLETIFEE